MTDLIKDGDLYGIDYLNKKFEVMRMFDGDLYDLHFIIDDTDEVLDLYNNYKFLVYDIMINFLNMKLDTYEKLNNNIELIPEKAVSLSQSDYLKFRLYKLIDKYLNIFTESVNYVEDIILHLSHKNEPEYFRPFSFIGLQQFQKELQDNLLISKNNYSCNMAINLDYHMGIVTEYYRITDIKTFIIFSIKRLNTANKIIKKCENCGDYFIPSTKNEIYCDKVYPNGRTCKLMGYENKIKRDDNKIMHEYRKAYKNHNAIMNRTKHTGSKAKERWDSWRISAKEKLKECQNELITFEEFKEWLTKN